MVHVAEPPDASTRRPRATCPPGAVDAHVHMFGPQSEFPLIDESPYVTADALPESCRAMHEAIGISYAVLVSGGGYGRSYEYLLHVLERSGGLLRGVAVPPETLSKREMNRLHAAGVRGIRFASDSAWTHVAHIDRRLARFVADWGWHVQFIPLRSVDIESHASRLLELPNDLVIDHFARVPAVAGVDQAVVRQLFRLLDTGRVWVKLSGPMYSSCLEFPYADVCPIAQALVRHAPERLVWGSDWPHLHMKGRQMPNDGDLFDLLACWVPDESIRNRILVDNAHILYDF